MAYGDHIFIARSLGYTHHGVDIGNGSVIHRSTCDGTKRGASVRETSIDEFLDGGELRIRRYGTRLSPDLAVARAQSMLGRQGYDLVFDNCEHFATWCVAGAHASAQVEDTLSGIRLAGVGVGGPSAGLNLVKTVGRGPTLSAPNLMSGLAAIGGTVVGGLVLTAGSVGAATTYGICRLMPDNELLPDDERTARRIGRYTAAGSAIAGTAASVHLVGAMGVAGYTATGLSSGFAALGATVGGGMAAGIVTAIALPSLLAIGLGLLLYAAARWWFEPATERAARDQSRGLIDTL